MEEGESGSGGILIEGKFPEVVRLPQLREGEEADGPSDERIVELDKYRDAMECDQRNDEGVRVLTLHEGEQVSYAERFFREDVAEAFSDHFVSMGKICLVRVGLPDYVESKAVVELLNSLAGMSCEEEFFDQKDAIKGSYIVFLSQDCENPSNLTFIPWRFASEFYEFQDDVIFESDVFFILESKLRELMKVGLYRYLTAKQVRDVLKDQEKCSPYMEKLEKYDQLFALVRDYFDDDTSPKRCKVLLEDIRELIPEIGEPARAMIASCVFKYYDRDHLLAVDSDEEVDKLTQSFMKKGQALGELIGLEWFPR